jgi:serine phosphatase RsbU (regulator of sigma subunit)
MALDLTHREAAEKGDRPAATLDALAAGSRALAEEPTLPAALRAVVQAAARAVGATVAVARVLDPEGDALHARAVVSDSPALAAVIEGSSIRAGEVVAEADERSMLPPAVRAAAVQAGAEAVLLLPVIAAGRLVGSLELLRPRRPFGAEERLVARVAADHVAAAVRSFGAVHDDDAVGAAERVLEFAGEALAAGADETATATEVARVAVRATAGIAALVWARGADGALTLVATHGAVEAAAVEKALPLAERATSLVRTASVDPLPGLCCVVTLSLGQPPARILQLFFPESAPPPERVLVALATFAIRAAQALRTAEQGRTVRLELQRTRTLLELVAQTNQELSLSHTLQTAIEQVADLLDADRIGVYLREGGRLLPAAGRALAGPHAPVAERLLDRALGPLRGRGMLVVEDAAADPALAGLESELVEAGIEAAVAVPLLVPNEVVGLLAVYPPAGRGLSPNERSLLAALAAQLAVSVQNARLHEQATELGTELEQVLELERQAARQLRSFYEISRSFAQSLSLEATLEAVATAVVELLEVDAAVIRMPDARGETLVPRALHVAEATLAAPLREVLSEPQPLNGLPRRSLRTGKALVLDAESAGRFAAHRMLTPFLEKGSTAVVLPIATPNELLGTVELLSLDPARPITRETIDLGLSVAAQAALAIENARLYQHQKEFADTMQRSLLPHEEPSVEGIELGEVYAPSARLDVGGDLYDFLVLEDGRLAVVLGDVTGHGVDAAADMAMAKFVFRSLAREHPEPARFLAAANDVVVGEIAPGKFITMLYLTVEPNTGKIACASAGHPRPRIVLPDGTVRPLEARGLALGIEPGQEYAEECASLPPGAAVVLYTDGVVEARRDGELYGSERLDRVLVDGRELPARELALAVLDDCRVFGGGDLADDCAIVVIRRTGH